MPEITISSVKTNISIKQLAPVRAGVMSAQKINRAIYAQNRANLNDFGTTVTGKLSWRGAKPCCMQ
jgi:hypothetical protein